MNEPVTRQNEETRRAAFFRAVKKYSLLVSTAAVLLAILIMFFLSLSALHTFQREAAQQLKETEERNREALALVETRLEQNLRETETRMTTLLANTSEEILDAVLGNRRQVGALNTTYGDLLVAQKRRTLEGLYEEDALAVQQKEAAAAFAEGRYVAASRLYGEIAAAHRDDRESRFFQYYALFLSGRQNRDNYRVIRDAFTLLERQGYSRWEMTETLAFIEAERGAAGETP